jgi:hypothetical protein
VHGRCPKHGITKLYRPQKYQNRKICLACTPTVADECPKCKDETVLAYDGIRPHDCRRSAGVAMTKARIPREEIKAIGGWLTDDTFQRYQIIDEERRNQSATDYEKWQIDEDKRI